MGQINDFASHTFTSMRRQGEALEMLGIGLFTGREHPTYAVMGLTNQRLLILESPGDAWACAPKPEVHGTTSLELGELAQVRAELGSNLHGPLKRFVLVRPQGETFVLLRPAHKQFGNLWNFGGFDGHLEFHDFVPDWMARHVAGGSFRSPQGIAAALNELRGARTQRAAATAHNAQVMAHASAVAKATASIKWPYALAGATVLVILLGAFMTFRGSRDVAHEEDFPAMVQREKKEKYSLYADPKFAARALEYSAQRKEQGYERMMMGGGVLGLGVLGCVGFVVLGVALNKKKRARLQREGMGVPGMAPGLVPT